MNKLSHCCKARAENINWKDIDRDEQPQSNIVCTKCGCYCKEWKEKRDLKKEFFALFKDLAYLHCDCDSCDGYKNKLWQWISDNFNAKS